YHDDGLGERHPSAAKPGWSLGELPYPLKVNPRKRLFGSRCIDPDSRLGAAGTIALSAGPSPRCASPQTARPYRIPSELPVAPSQWQSRSEPPTPGRSFDTQIHWTSPPDPLYPSQL